MRQIDLTKTYRSQADEIQALKSFIWQLVEELQYKESEAKTLLDAYPVGSVYMSIEDTDPATLFGGAWETIQDFPSVNAWKRTR